MNKSPKGFGESNQKDIHFLQKQLDKRMEECGGDLMTYMERYNRHTLRISLTDEQVGRELWGDKSVTFFNEDNSLSHMGFLSDLLDLLTQKENRMWGTGSSDEELVERVTSFVRKRVSPPDGFKKEEV